MSSGKGQIKRNVYIYKQIHSWCPYKNMTKYPASSNFIKTKIFLHFTFLINKDCYFLLRLFLQCHLISKSTICALHPRAKLTKLIFNRQPTESTHYNFMWSKIVYCTLVPRNAKIKYEYLSLKKRVVKKTRTFNAKIIANEKQPQINK